jgi:hypothetical protein
MPSEQLNSAIATIKSGDKATGSRLLAKIILAEPSNETAWIWLATCVDDVEKKKYCLKKALSLNPGNYTYIRAIIKLELSIQPNIEDIPAPYLPPRTSSDNKLVYEEDKSEISAPLAIPVLPSVRSSSPFHYTYRKYSSKIDKFFTILTALLISLVCVICSFLYFFPDLYSDLFQYIFSH